MENTDKKTEEKNEAPIKGGDNVVENKKDTRGNDHHSDNKDFKKNPRRAPRREARTKPEFDQKIINIRRVTRVVSGGRRFSFSVGIVAGNRKGSVGVGQGKASDTPLAIEKAFRDAKKNMVKLNLTKEMSIPYETQAKYGGSVVKIIPTPGKGVLAGSSVRTVLEFAGIKAVSAKIFSRSKNPVNNARVAIKALDLLKDVKIVDKKEKK